MVPPAQHALAMRLRTDRTAGAPRTSTWVQWRRPGRPLLWRGALVLLAATRCRRPASSRLYGAHRPAGLARACGPAAARLQLRLHWRCARIPRLQAQGLSGRALGLDQQPGQRRGRRGRLEARQHRSCRQRLVVRQGDGPLQHLVQVEQEALKAVDVCAPARPQGCQASRGPRPARRGHPLSASASQRVQGGTLAVASRDRLSSCRQAWPQGSTVTLPSCLQAAARRLGAPA